MKSLMKRIFGLTAVCMLVSALAFTAYADVPAADETAAEEMTEETAEDSTGSKAIAAAICVGAAAAAGAVAMGIVVSKSSESIARQPEASGEIRSGTMLGLVFIETAIIYALIIGILIIFVL